MSVKDNLIAARVKLGEATARAEALFWIPSLTSGAPPPREFRDFCEDLPDDRSHLLYLAIPSLLNALDEGDFDPELIAEDLFQSGVGGFIVQGATPFFDVDADGQAHSYSWGHYYTEWLYAPDEASIADVIVSWAEMRHSQDRDRAIAAQDGVS